MQCRRLAFAGLDPDLDLVAAGPARSGRRSGAVLGGFYFQELLGFWTI
jgi:hypothetical protein